MALNWDLTRIKDFEDVCYRVAEEDDPHRDVKKGDKLLNVVTESLIFATMAAGIGMITKKNWKKFYSRISFVEKSRGSFRSGQKGPVFFSAEEVRAHIGLTCNVSDESDTKWLRRIYENHAREREYECREL